jgi:hypothetical protein
MLDVVHQSTYLIYAPFSAFLSTKQKNHQNERFLKDRGVLARTYNDGPCGHQRGEPRGWVGLLLLWGGGQQPFWPIGLVRLM